MSEADRQYLGGHDVPMTVERMTCMLISDKPADPVVAMIQWLGAQKATPPPRPLRLHQFAVSVNCLQVALFLKDSGLPVEIVNLDPTASPPPHKAAAYVAKFPRGQVPALEDGDVYLEESTAMLRYVCNRYRLGAPWYPVDPVARYQVDRVLDWRQSTFYPALGKLCYPGSQVRVRARRSPRGRRRHGGDRQEGTRILPGASPEAERLLRGGPPLHRGLHRRRGVRVPEGSPRVHVSAGVPRVPRALRRRVSSLRRSYEDFERVDRIQGLATGAEALRPAAPRDPRERKGAPCPGGCMCTLRLRRGPCSGLRCASARPIPFPPEPSRPIPPPPVVPLSAPTP